MKRIHKFLRLPPKDQCILVKAAFLLLWVRLALWLLPFKTWRDILLKMVRPNAKYQKVDSVSIERVVWGVSVASRYVPFATCLTQAMAAYLLLARCGHTTLRIGVASEKGQFKAHAWLESEGKIIIGGSNDLSQYTLLPLHERNRS